MPGQGSRMTDTGQDDRGARTARWLLWAGLALGLAAALVGILTAREPAGLGPGEVALVGRTAITREMLDRALYALSLDLKRPPTEEDRRAALDRLIDEELLVQRAAEIGLAQDDPNVRKLLVRAMIAVAIEGGREPAESELAAYFSAHKELFRPAPLLRVEDVFVGRDDSDAGKRQFLLQLAAQGDEAAWARLRSLGIARAAAIPDGWLTPAKLADYIGAETAGRLAALAPGAMSAVVERDGGWWLGRVVETSPGDARPFAEIKDEIAARWRQERDAAALRSYLDTLRARADIALGVAP